MDQFLDPETDANRQFLDPETDKNFQFLDKNLLDPETDVMEQFLGPETDIKHQFLDPETDIKRQFLVDHPETDIMDQFLDPETDIMGEGTYIVRLKAVSDHDLPQREVGVQHRAKARIAKLRMTRGCKNCCCYSHCVLSEHGSAVGGLDMNVQLSKEYLFPDLLDRSWMECEDYKVELLDNMPVVEDKLVSILYAINTDFDMDKSDDCEEELFASADKSRISALITE